MSQRPKRIHRRPERHREAGNTAVVRENASTAVTENSLPVDDVDEIQESVGEVQGGTTDLTEEGTPEQNDFEPQPKAYLPGIEIFPMLRKNDNEIIWADISYSMFIKKVEKIYGEIVFFRKNLFKIPSGKAGKEFIQELTFWMRQFNGVSKLNGVALKVFMILPALLLQKPSPKSKAKDHSECLSRRLKQWKDGDLDVLEREVRRIQSSLKNSKRPTSDNVSKSFSKLMMEGKVSAALKLLTKESSNGVLPLNDDVMAQLVQKHPKPASVESNSLLYGPWEHTPECFFDVIDEQAVLKAALNSKGSAGPSGLDAESFRRVLCSKSFGTCSKTLREEIALLAKNLATKTYHPCLVEAFVACRLLPIDKNPGVRPIGVGEVLRRIIGKMLGRLAADEIKEAAGPLQTCAGHGAGAEAAIHAMRQLFQQDDNEGVLLIDATNAFNCLNRMVALHNIQITCPMIATYLVNSYRSSSKLFVSGGETILSQEGTTQGDPLAMPWYSLSTTLMIYTLCEALPSVKQVWLADDASAAGKIEELFQWFQRLEIEGKKHGYLVNGKKSWLIVKSDEAAEKAKAVFGELVNVTVDGKRHLGAALGSDKYKEEYCNEMVARWVDELTCLCEIAEAYPQSAYAAFTKGYLSKFTYFLRTIENFGQYTQPIDDIISDKFIPILFGLDVPPGQLRQTFPQGKKWWFRTSTSESRSCHPI